MRGWATVTQSAWAIKPYTAFPGALRLADEVRVEFEMAGPGLVDRPGQPPFAVQVRQPITALRVEVAGGSTPRPTVGA